MPSETEATSPEPDGLQFDHAEFEDAEGSAEIACASCKREIEVHYYEINGTLFCESCRGLIEAHLRSGSGFVRFLKAIVLGTGAALLGALAYFAVLHFLNIQAALVSILCGFLVGKAVRKGSGNRGGWIYQILAVLLTYIAIGMAYAADRIADFLAGAPANPLAPVELIVVFVDLTVRIPVLLAQANILSGLIIVFALWEAWKFTKATKLIFNGPYRVGESDPGAGIEGVAGHA